MRRRQSTRWRCRLTGIGQRRGVVGGSGRSVAIASKGNEVVHNTITGMDNIREQIRGHVEADQASRRIVPGDR